MADQLQLRGGTTNEHSTFTGALREVTVDTDKDTLIVHDAATAGGHPLLREDLSNLPAGTIDNADINASAAITGTKIDPDFGSQTVETTGVFSAAGGAQATPSITFTGDLNTGIYSPGADQVAVATNGVGRLFVDASGNVGIGAASFGYGEKLGVGGTIIASDGTVVGRITSAAGTAFWGTATNHPLAFQINGTERLRITSAGLVGIGTSAPGTTLDVRAAQAQIRATSSTGTNFAFYSATNGTGSSRMGVETSTGGALLAGSSAYSTVLGSASNHPLHLGTNATTAVTIDSSQRVGIGTTSPEAQLQIKGGVSRTDYWTPAGKYSAKLGLVTATDTDVYAGITGSYQNGTSANLILQARYGDFGSTNGVVLKNSSSNAGGLAICSLTATSGGAVETERARIDGSGRLLVGTSSSSANSLLVVQGNTVSASNSGKIHIARGTTSLANNGTVLGSLVFSDSSLSESAVISVRTDGGTWASGTSEPTRLEFSTTADGASSPTERMRINNSGAIATTCVQNDAYALVVNHNGANGNQYGALIATANDQNSSTEYFLTCRGGATEKAKILANGGFANYQANDVNLSDRNVKKDVSPAGDTWDCVKQWEIVNYRYKDQPDLSDLNLGVIAQQVAESCPEVITVFQEAKQATEDQPAQEERLGVKEQQMYWMAIKALQEAQVRIEALEAEVAALKA